MIMHMSVHLVNVLCVPQYSMYIKGENNGSVAMFPRSPCSPGIMFPGSYVCVCGGGGGG